MRQELVHKFVSVLKSELRRNSTVAEMDQRCGLPIVVADIRAVGCFASESTIGPYIVEELVGDMRKSVYLCIELRSLMEKRHELGDGRMSCVDDVGTQMSHASGRHVIRHQADVQHVIVAKQCR